MIPGIIWNFLPERLRFRFPPGTKTEEETRLRIEEELRRREWARADYLRRISDPESKDTQQDS